MFGIGPAWAKTSSREKREPSIINEKTICDFTRLVDEQTAS
jgi:hypothetical protein